MTNDIHKQEDAVKCSAEEAKVVAESKETPATPLIRFNVGVNKQSDIKSVFILLF